MNLVYVCYGLQGGEEEAGDGDEKDEQTAWLSQGQHLNICMNIDWLILEESIRILEYSINGSSGLLWFRGGNL